MIPVRLEAWPVESKYTLEAYARVPVRLYVRQDGVDQSNASDIQQLQAISPTLYALSEYCTQGGSNLAIFLPFPNIRPLWGNAALSSHVSLGKSASSAEFSKICGDTWMRRVFEAKEQSATRPHAPVRRATFQTATAECLFGLALILPLLSNNCERRMDVEDCISFSQSRCRWPSRATFTARYKSPLFAPEEVIIRAHERVAFPPITCQLLSSQ